MDWFRSRRGLGGGLALFALALQLLLSFGHTHAEDFAAAPGHAIVAPADPSPDEDGDRHHADCAICAVIHLTGTLLLPAPPHIALPAAETFARVATRDLREPSRAPRQPFQARAPPQA